MWLLLLVWKPLCACFRLQKKRRVCLFVGEDISIFEKAEEVGRGARHPFAHFASPQVLQAGIEVRCMTNYIFFAFKPLKRFGGFLSCVEEAFVCMFSWLEKAGSCLLVGEDISCVTQYDYFCFLKPLKRFRVAFSFLCVEVQVPRG